MARLSHLFPQDVFCLEGRWVFFGPPTSKRPRAAWVDFTQNHVSPERTDQGAAPGSDRYTLMTGSEPLVK